MKEKKERNIEIHKRVREERWSLRKAAEHYNLHWTTIAQICERWDDRDCRELSTEPVAQM